jgi:hypothetical protein
MEDLKETIAAKEGLKLWFDRNLVKRKAWYDNCKERVRALEKEIVADKKKLAKLTKTVVDARTG